MHNSADKGDHKVRTLKVVILSNNGLWSWGVLDVINRGVPAIGMFEVWRGKLFPRGVEFYEGYGVGVQYCNKRFLLSWGDSISWLFYLHRLTSWRFVLNQLQPKYQCRRKRFKHFLCIFISRLLVDQKWLGLMWNLARACGVIGALPPNSTTLTFTCYQIENSWKLSKNPSPSKSSLYVISSPFPPSPLDNWESSDWWMLIFLNGRQVYTAVLPAPLFTKWFTSAKKIKARNQQGYAVLLAGTKEAIHLVFLHSCLGTFLLGWFLQMIPLLQSFMAKGPLEMGLWSLEPAPYYYSSED